MPQKLTCQRDAFVIPEGVCYMNCSYMSPMLKTVEQTAISGIHRRREPWAITPPDFFEPSEKVRSLFAASVSYGVAIAANNIPVRTGQNIVILKEQFPSNVYPWVVLAEEQKLELRRVPYPENDDLTRHFTQLDLEFSFN